MCLRDRHQSIYLDHLCNIFETTASTWVPNSRTVQLVTSIIIWCYSTVLIGSQPFVIIRKRIASCNSVFKAFTLQFRFVNCNNCMLWKPMAPTICTRVHEPSVFCLSDPPKWIPIFHYWFLMHGEEEGLRPLYSERRCANWLIRRQHNILIEPSKRTSKRH